MKTTLTALLITLTVFAFGQELAVNELDIDKVYVDADEQAKYPGGVVKMAYFIKGEINYPEEAIKNDISGRVFVQYVIEKDGSLSNLEVVKKLGFGCDEEAIRIFEDMPKWTPAKIDGKPVRQKMISPVYFKYKPESGN